MLTCAITLISGMLKYHAVIFHHWIFQSGLIDVHVWCRFHYFLLLGCKNFIDERANN
uniref:Uncharacterized protein n=1 Tax=Ascaris lumbricoides TaxID=6252 RepID=A0A0M3IRQ1_ASCLU